MNRRQNMSVGEFRSLVSGLSKGRHVSAGGIASALRPRGDTVCALAMAGTRDDLERTRPEWNRSLAVLPSAREDDVLPTALMYRNEQEMAGTRPAMTIGGPWTMGRRTMGLGRWGLGRWGLGRWGRGRWGGESREWIVRPVGISAGWYNSLTRRAVRRDHRVPLPQGRERWTVVRRFGP
jgi:hypothetical protein